MSSDITMAAPVSNYALHLCSHVLRWYILFCLYSCQSGAAFSQSLHEKRLTNANRLPISYSSWSGLYAGSQLQIQRIINKFDLAIAVANKFRRVCASNSSPSSFCCCQKAKIVKYMYYWFSTFGIEWWNSSFNLFEFTIVSVSNVKPLFL